MAEARRIRSNRQSAGAYARDVPTIGFTMALSADADGKLHADVSPPSDDERFSITSATLVLRMWRESAGIIRCSVYHPASGTTAYVQGNGNLTQLAEVLRLELRH